jgi:glyceraldehyde 3-phosphate dehydrogenase
MSNTLFIAGLGGRIFTCTLRALADQGHLTQLKGVSASGFKNLQEIAEKIEHDSTHRFYPLDVYSRGLEEGEKISDGHFGYLVFVDRGSVLEGLTPRFKHEVPTFAAPDPSTLPLEFLGIDVAIDATGKFLTKEKAQSFLDAGAKKVIMSAPAKDDTPLVLYGINDEADTGLAVVSRASCTTTCAAPIVKALSEVYGMPKNIFLNTTHAITNSQLSLDGNASKFANGFGCMDNIVVTDTGATKSLQRMFPEIENTFGISCRVPVTNGSILSLVMEFDEAKQKMELNKENVLAALLAYEADHPLNLRLSHRKTMVSTYVIGRGIGSIVAPAQIEVLGKNVHVVAGYDNEYGYSFLLRLSALNAPLPQ